MNKTVVTIIGFILVGIIGYQAYLLDQSSDNPVFKTKKDEPKITVEIEKKSIEKEVRELNRPTIAQTQKEHQVQNNLQQNFNQLDPKEMFDEEQIKKDMSKLFKDIFGNPKLQEGIKQGIQQMQQQLQQGLKEMEKEFGKFEELSKNDDFFKDLLGGLGTINQNRLKFTDRGDDYYLKLPIPNAKDANIDIKTKANLLILTITQKNIKDQTNSNSSMHSEQMSKNQNILLIPDDAFIDKLQTNYENGTLEITIPKVDKVAS